MEDEATLHSGDKIYRPLSVDLSESAGMTPSHALRSLSPFEADLQLSEPSRLSQQLENQILAEEPGNHVDLQQTPDTSTQAEKPASKRRRWRRSDTGAGRLSSWRVPRRAVIRFGVTSATVLSRV
jgi:hypothetical protein